LFRSGVRGPDYPEIWAILGSQIRGKGSVLIWQLPDREIIKGVEMADVGLCGYLKKDDAGMEKEAWAGPEGNNLVGSTDNLNNKDTSEPYKVAKRL
jgi:hypothetical protein